MRYALVAALLAISTVGVAQADTILTESQLEQVTAGSLGIYPVYPTYLSITPISGTESNLSITPIE